MKHFAVFAVFVLSCGCGKNRTIVQLSRLPDSNIVSAVHVNKFEETEFWNSRLSSSQLSLTSTSELIDSLLHHPEYRQNQYLIARNDLMNFIFDPDSAEIEKTIKVWEQAEVNEKGRKEIIRLKGLQAIPRDLGDGSLDNIGLHKRLVHNSYYDFINMGTENFVVSMYHNFLDRNPTTYELEQGKKMVNGNPAVLDFRQGSGKEDFINLFFDSYAYFEGQVKKVFLRLLFREPVPGESVYFTLEFKKTKNYELLQKQVLLHEGNKSF